MQKLADRVLARGADHELKKAKWDWLFSTYKYMSTDCSSDEELAELAGGHQRQATAAVDEDTSEEEPGSSVIRSNRMTKLRGWVTHPPIYRIREVSALIYVIMVRM